MKKRDFKGKSKPRWQQKKEKQESKYSQFDPKIHTMSKSGIGFSMKKGHKEKPGESSGANLKDLPAKWRWPKRQD